MLWQLLFTLFFSFVLIKLIIKYATVLKLRDIPNGRSIHTNITPRGAGIGFGLATFVSIIVFNNALFCEHWLLFLALFFVFVIGILDDHKDATPKMKFYVMFASTILLFIHGTVIDDIGIYFGVTLSLWYFALPFTMIAVAGFTNGLNLIDGLDGLAAMVSLIILGVFLYLGVIYEDTLLVTLTLVPMSALAAFLIFNWHPAKIFMGDSGSLFLGFLISVVAIVSLKYIHPVSALYIVALPILDTLVVMVRRIRKKQSPFAPDKTHIHHILLQFFGKNVKKTVFFLVLLQGVFSLAGLMLAQASQRIGKDEISTIALVAFVGMIVLFYMVFTGIKRRQLLIEKLAMRKKRGKKRKT